MSFGQTHGNDQTARRGGAYLAGLVLLYEDPIHAEGTRAGGQAEHERVRRRGGKVLYAVDDVVGYIGTRGLGCFPDDEPHLETRLKGV
jgi:hypothetical protein